MKKTMIICMMCLVAVLVFGACSHTHTFSTEWTRDANKHWHAATCGHDTEKQGEALHTFDEEEIVKQATCTEKGVKKVTCSVCGYSKNEDIDTIAHVYGEDYVSDANQHWHECTVCHHKKDVENHQFDTDGKCMTCGYQKTDTPPGHQHTFADTWEHDETNHWHPATCEHKDQKQGVAPHEFGTDDVCDVCNYVRPAHQHTFSEEWSSDDTYHWHAPTCGHENASDGSRARHEWKDGKCSVCGRAQPTEEHEHKLVAEKGYPATCEGEGQKDHYKCECGELFENEDSTEPCELEDLVIEPLGHKLNKVDGKPSTCNTKGTITYYECENCHNKYKTNDAKQENLVGNVEQDLDPTNHEKLEFVEAKEGNCIEYGVKAHYHCVCGKDFDVADDGKSADTNKPLTAEQLRTEKDRSKHVMPLEYHPADKPTCDEEQAGFYEYYKCTGCNLKFSDPNGEKVIEDNDLKMPTIDHNYDNSACVSNGSDGHYRVCRGCGKPEQDENGSTKITAHDFDDNQVCKYCGYGAKDGDEGEIVIDDITYTYAKGNAIVTKLVGTNSHFAILSKIEVNGKEYTVTEIADNAFKKSTITVYDNTILIIPDSITKIGASAFEGQNTIVGIVIGDNVTEYGANAFKGMGNSDFTVYYKGDSKEKYEANTKLTEALKEVKDRVTKAGTSEPDPTKFKVYYYADERPEEDYLNHWHFTDSYDEKPEVYTTKFDYDDRSSFIRYSLDQSTHEATVVGYMGTEQNVVLVIPSEITMSAGTFTVTVIGERAFYAGSGYASYGNPRPIRFKAIVLPDTIKRIETEAFFGQGPENTGKGQIEYIVIGKEVEEIGYRSFTMSTASVFLNQAMLFFRGTESELAEFRSKLEGMSGNGDASKLAALKTYSLSEEAPELDSDNKYWHFTDKNDETTAMAWFEGLLDIDGIQYYYYTMQQRAEVIGGGIDDNIKIKESITVSEGGDNIACTVDTIVANAFSCNSSEAYIRKIEIPKSIKTIGPNAFRNQKRITQIVIHNDGLTIQGDSSTSAATSDNPFFGAFGEGDNSETLRVYFNGTDEEYKAFEDTNNPFIARINLPAIKNHTKIYTYSDTAKDYK